MDMRPLARIRLRSFARLSLTYGVSAGIALWMIGAVIFLLGGSAELRIQDIVFSGTTAILLSLALIPVCLGFLAWILSPIVLLPFNLALRLTGGLMLVQAPSDPS